MARLGYHRFGAQGGDWGAMGTAYAALAAPDACIGIHLNMVPSLLVEDVRAFFRPLRGRAA